MISIAIFADKQTGYITDSLSKAEKEKPEHTLVQLLPDKATNIVQEFSGVSKK